jgi:hypothetical protein
LPIRLSEHSLGRLFSRLHVPFTMTCLSKSRNVI